MTPTEEQLEAIRDVSDLPRAIGCTQCHSYIQEHYGNQFAILRAMIDSSDHIVEPDELIGFDLEKVREAVHTLENFAFASGKITAGQIQDVLWGARLLAGASTEIERMRTKVEKMEFLMRSTDDTCLACAIKVEVVDQQTTRIKELENALAEYRKLGKTIAGKVPCLTLQGDCGRCSTQVREVCGALEQIAGGKIGPAIREEAIRQLNTTRSWQITDERKEALQAMGNMKTLIVCPHCKTPIEFVDIPRYMAVLRAMLEGNL